ncbi:YkgJ family cysteine cluster protein [Bacillus thuringiensis]|uniref:YkgJ family cysteine cluster protein n=1 Tax=Bacillus thuringiensis TaxID=1428 RepID=UPI000BFB16F1|nr:YkgJ family cysteine cluster protein [Bacillus thuringiensis]PGM47116.1 hypothetical protein CN949_26760 [Bacillus thuringiensis]
MRVYFSFPNNRIKYDCISCQATCCHVNNFVQITDNQKETILNENPDLQDFIEKKGKSSYLYTGKKCWFLKDYQCSLEKQHGHEKKPLSCQLYPLKLRRLNSDLIVVDYIPCPNFEIVESGGISHNDKLRVINDTVDNLTLYNQDINISDQRMDIEENFKNEFYNSFTDYLNYLKKVDMWLLLNDQQKKNAKKIFWLYPQLRIQPSLLALPYKWTLTTVELYANIICEIIYNNVHIDNLQNLYSLVLNKFAKISKTKNFLSV